MIIPILLFVFRAVGVMFVCVNHFTDTVKFPKELWSLGMNGCFDFEYSYKICLTCKQFYSLKQWLIADALSVVLNKVINSHDWCPG